VKVRSPLADLDIEIGEVRRVKNRLILKSAPGSSLDAAITVSAREALRIIGRILTSGAGLVFVLCLPFFWLRQRLGMGESEASRAAERPPDINKPW
jgi:hypothetical protein